MCLHKNRVAEFMGAGFLRTCSDCGATISDVTINYVIYYEVSKHVPKIKLDETKKSKKAIILLNSYRKKYENAYIEKEEKVTIIN